jgi:hypothetical protein
MPALSTTDADCDSIVPIPPTRKKRTGTNSSSHVEAVVETVTPPATPDPEPEPEIELRSHVAPEQHTPSPTQGAIPKKKKSFFKKLKEIDINININVNDSDKKEEKDDDAPPKRPTSLHINSTKLIESAEETIGRLRRSSGHHFDHVLSAMSTKNGTGPEPPKAEEPKPEESIPEEPKPKFLKKKSLFGKFESVDEAKQEEPEEAKPKPKAPEKEKRKSFFSKKESEKQKDKVLYGRIPNTNLVNAGTQTGEKEPEQKKSLAEKVVDIQEKVHMVATGMAVSNKTQRFHLNYGEMNSFRFTVHRIRAE